MSYIKIDMNTDKDTKDISIEMKSECTLNELQAATGYLMAGLAAEYGVEVLESMVNELKVGSDES